MTRSAVTTSPPGATRPPTRAGAPASVRADTTPYPLARCGGISGRRAYLEAEGRIGFPDGPVAVPSAEVFVEVGTEHFAVRGDATTIADEHHEYEGNP
ncbi:hypothetical protein [Streptosporangium lutulentum]|uniref:Uncharacterized protein n=1 Tax=Streptosporangium lutulentum TaxID=1461250 RepID=A0ABT9Q356_9ACTN|nr:hypothetical protein [Streptosporangium lutulentum]MDP9841155.1 hypothetical protein [Streptosporangium lutulentum]